MHVPEKTTLLLHANSTAALAGLLPRLKASLAANNVWLRGSVELSTRAADLHLEFHHHAVQDLYTALIRCGLHLSRPTHIALASLCTRDRISSGGPLHGTLEIRCVSLGSLHRLREAFPLSA